MLQIIIQELKGEESAEVLSENNPKVCALQIGLLHLMQKQLLLN